MQLSHFDLNLLRALDILLAERNVTRAAERLCVTQQAASSALQRLRRHFNDELLTRVGRNLELTPLAVSLVMPVREALLNVQTALRTRAIRPGDRGLQMADRHERLLPSRRPAASASVPDDKGAASAMHGRNPDPGQFRTARDG